MCRAEMPPSSRHTSSGSLASGLAAEPLRRAVNEPRNGRRRLGTSIHVINRNAVTVQRHRPAFSVFVGRPDAPRHHHPGHKR